MRTRNTVTRVPFAALALASASLAWLLLAPSAAAVKLGVMGDSLSDEYEEVSYVSYAENWVEQLSIYAGIDVGPTAAEAGEPSGSWGPVRRTGYEYNWALAGATSNSLLKKGQHTGLAAQVSPEGIAYAVLAIGANDFHPEQGPYQNIYAGNWSQSEIDEYVAESLANINTAIDTVLATGVHLVVGNVSDYGITATVRSVTGPIGRQRVADVISQLNQAIDASAQTRELVVVDVFGAGVAIFGPHDDPQTELLIGNVTIHLDQGDTGGGNPTAAFVEDGIHPNTTIQGIFANAMMAAINIAYGANLTLFTEEQILAHRGIAYGGSDTLLTELGGDYSDFISNYASPLPLVPVLPPWGLAILASLLLATALGALRPEN